MDIAIKIILIFCCAGLIFVSPPAIYTAMFLGIFYRKKIKRLDESNLVGTDYYPHREAIKESMAEVIKIPCEMINIRSRDNLNLAARYYDNKAEITLILVHGYQTVAFNNFSFMIPFLVQKGYNVLAIDQRSHGLSGGHFSTMGCKEQFDLLDWISWAEENTEAKNIFVYGISMGAATVGYASDKIKSSKVKGLMMEAGFTSFYEELSNSIEGRFMYKTTLKNITWAAKKILGADITAKTTQSLENTEKPVLFLHGTCDSCVSLNNTEKSFEACKTEKEFVLVEDAAHTLCFLVGGEKVKNAITDFIEKYKVKA